jgi:hypothetical protein
VNGIGFASGASAYWDGELLSTEFVNSNQLRATVPAGLVASAGSHSVIVINPPPAVAQTAPILFAVQPVGKAVPSITATPSTILAMWGHPASQAMISWNAPGYNQVEVRINQYNGVLLCTGGPTGSVSTGDWGPELYLLVDPLTQEVLASVTVTMLIDTRNIGTPRQPGRPKHTQAQGGAEGLRRVGDSN